jgi:surfactin synthase thioesterase subunit
VPLRIGEAILMGNAYLPFLDASAHPGRPRLFCLPHAGAGASTYRAWPAAFAPHVDVQPVQLPGRENLLAEELVSDSDTVVRQLAERLAPAFDRPFALFGHSMGALLAAELTAALERAGGPLPALLVVSGRGGRVETNGTIQRWWAHVDDDELVRETLRQGVTDPEVFADPELREMIIEILRNDYELCARYRPSFDRLTVPILAFAGTADDRAPIEDVLAWRDRTVARCEVRALPGDHFFPYRQISAIAAETINVLRRLTIDD